MKVKVEQHVVFRFVKKIRVGVATCVLVLLAASDEIAIVEYYLIPLIIVVDS